MHSFTTSYHTDSYIVMNANKFNCFDILKYNLIYIESICIIASITTTIFFLNHE